VKNLEKKYTKKKLMEDIVIRIYELMLFLQLRYIVIWGHPLHSHTHSYIHEAFFMAGKYLNIPTYWVPQICFYEQNKVKNLGYFPQDNTLFITEGQVIDGIPESNESFYIFHNVTNRTKISIPSNRILNLQVFNKDALGDSFPLFDNFQRINIEKKVLYMPWATNLLPHEFFDKIEVNNVLDTINITGQSGYEDTIHSFVEGVGLPLNRRAGLSYRDSIQHVRNSICAPSIITKQQKEMRYVPCRTFKNLSYGQICVTNSLESFYILHYNAVYDDNEYKLGKLFLDSSKETWNNFESCKALVKVKHTYLNRVELLLESLLLCSLPIKMHTICVLHIGTTSFPFIDFICAKLGWNLEHHTKMSTNKQYDFVIVTDQVNNQFDDYSHLIAWNNPNWSQKQNGLLIVSATKQERMNEIRNKFFNDNCKFSELILRPIFDYGELFDLTKNYHVGGHPIEEDKFQHLDSLPNDTILKDASIIIYVPRCNNMWMFAQMLQGTIYILPKIATNQELEWYDPYLKHLFVFFDSVTDVMEILDNADMLKLKRLENIKWLQREMNFTLESWKMLGSFIRRELDHDFYPMVS
jgi:hypothetical protein